MPDSLHKYGYEERDAKGPKMGKRTGLTPPEKVQHVA